MTLQQIKRRRLNEALYQHRDEWEFERRAELFALRGPVLTPPVVVSVVRPPAVDLAAASPACVLTFRHWLKGAS